MTVILSPELEQLIEEKIRTGEYPSAEAIVCTAIAQLFEGEEDFAPGELEAMIQIGLDELDRGEFRDGKAVFDDLRKRSVEHQTRTNL